jgi:hypothetical protein
MSSSIDHEPSFHPSNLERREVQVEKELLSFEDYRKLCDQEADCFRRLGILEEDSYNDALGDPRTVFCEVGNTKVPVLMPVDYEDRYNVDRIRDMTGKQDVMLLALPVVSVWQGMLDLNETTGGQALTKDMAILVEEPRTPQRERQIEPNYLSEMFGSFGEFQPFEFVDERLKDSERNRNAWMGMFEFSVQSNREIDPALLEMAPEAAMEEVWKRYCQEHDQPLMPEADATGPYLFSAEQLKEHPEIVDALWGISKVGFGEVLGQYHPVAMEVTRDFFEDHIKSDSVFTSVMYRNGEPLCFGFLAPNMKHNSWINMDASILQQKVQEAEANDELVTHFFELISKGQREVALSAGIMSLFMDMVSRIRPKTRTFFESTNFSQAIIPRMVELQVRRSEQVTLDHPVTEFAELDYWCMVSKET